MEYGVACSFSLCRRHALDIDCMYWAWNVRFEMIQYDFLALQWTHAFEGLRDDSDVEMVLSTVEVYRFNIAIWDYSADFFLEPITCHHGTVQQGLCFEPLSFWTKHAEAEVSA